MGERELVERFESHRAHLRGVASFVVRAIRKANARAAVNGPWPTYDRPLLEPAVASRP